MTILQTLLTNRQKCGIIMVQKQRKEVHTMLTLDSAIRHFGFEDSRTIAIAVLEEAGRTDLATDLLRNLLGSDEGEENE